MIDFFWGYGFPNKHTIRRYAENPIYLEKTASCLGGWRGYSKLTNNWFELSD